MWMTVCKESITDRSLPSDKAVLLIEWVLNKVPWFDTKTRHFELLHELETFVFAANSVFPATLSTYITVLARNLVPQDLTDGLDQVLAGQQVEVAGKRFANLDQLIAFIEEDVLEGRAFGEEHIEIENEQYIELLISLFKFSKNDFIAGNIQKITFGPHASSNGSYGAFKIHRASSMDPTAQDQARITDEKGGRVFAVPSRRSVIEEVVSYVDSGRSLFAENLFNTEQGYIRSVNGVYFPRYLEAVERLLKRFPLRLGDFFESITNSFPHPRSEKIALVCSARNLLSLAVMMPAIERSVVGFMVGILSQLDCDTNISSTKDRAMNGKEKIDDIMQSMIQFINFRLDVTPTTTLNQQRLEISQLEGVKIFRERRGGGKKPSTRDKEQFVHTLLETFSTRVLKLEKPRTVHFLYYYMCSIGGELEWVREAFLEGLVLNIGQPRLQRQPKLHSLLYLFSYLRASNSISGLILHTSLTYMLDFLTENYAKYLKRNSQVSVRKRSSEDIRKERIFRQAGTEITSPIGDDIFVFCYQSCLDLFTLKRSLLSREELDDLTTKFDHAVDKTLDFITFSIAESETFFILFRSLQDCLEDCQTRRILEELFSSCPQPTGGKFVSPRNRREAPTPVRRSAVLRDIDYLPFKPIQMKFYEFYISPHLALPGGCESTPEPVHSPFDSGLSQVDTNNTENYFRPHSPLSKRKPRPWPEAGSLSPMNKYST